jgi:hypothetical protein
MVFIDDEPRHVLISFISVWEAAIRSMPEREVTDAFPLDELEEEYPGLADGLSCDAWLYCRDGYGEEYSLHGRVPGQEAF